MSAIVTCLVTQGSARAKSGRFFTSGVSQVTVPRSTSRATTVAPTDFDNDASWKTVSASIGWPVSTLRTP